jgi:hypothetical protein
MPYYPKSQIKPNLYTNGGEYYLSTTNEDYKGYYYELSNNQKYTGKTPQDGPNILLLTTLPDTSEIISPDVTLNQNFIESLEDELITIQYNSIPNVQIPIKRSIPKFNLTIPTQQNYDLGVFTRYFCKKNNENIYLEIDEQTYKYLFSRNKNIAWDLYTPTYTLWYLTGNKDVVYKANKGLVVNIENTQKWYGFSQYFKDKFLQYYVES